MTYTPREVFKENSMSIEKTSIAVSSLKLGLVGLSVLSLVSCNTTSISSLFTGYDTLEDAKGKHVSIRANTTASFKFSIIDGSGTVTSPKNVLIRAHESGTGYKVLVNSKLYEFTVADQVKFTDPKTGDKSTAYQQVISSTETAVFIVANDQEPVSPKTKYTYSDGYSMTFTNVNSSDYTKSTIENYYGIYGIDTKAEDVPSSGTSLYNGEASWNMSNGSTKKIHSAAGDLSLSADFNASKITGSISGVTNRVSDNSGNETKNSNIGNLNISGTLVAGTNRFATTLTGNSSLNSFYGETIKGTGNGAFYGPGAAEVGGVFNINSSNYKGAGVLQGKK